MRIQEETIKKTRRENMQLKDAASEMTTFKEKMEIFEEEL